MKTEILMIGTELLLGQIQDTNATYVGQVLAENGIHLYQKTTVGDNLGRIMAALDGALGRSDVVLCSGGLGPTEDDITREAIAELLGRPLAFRQDLYDDMIRRFERLRLTENNKRQATLPVGAAAIENPYGTAPGVLVEDARGTIICMPGVPGELKPMLHDRVLPYLRAKFGLTGVLRYHSLKVSGVGESRIDSMIGELVRESSNPTVGLLASPDAVRIRIAAHAETEEAAEALIAPMAARVRDCLPGLIFGQDDETLEGTLDALLRKRAWTFSIVDGATGGTIAQRLFAAEAQSLRGARVLPPGDLAPEKLVDAARASMLESGTLCALALASSATRDTVHAVWESPTDRREWHYARFGSGELGHLRAAVVALEHVRRLLTGLPVNLP